VSGCSRTRGQRRDAGFTLIEVVIAFGILAVVMASAVPVLISMMKSTAVTKAETQGKNLAQQRLEQMRDLRFHVDRQNGPFLDLLDIYYTNASAAGTVTPVVTWGGTLTGSNVTSGAGPGEPTVPFYRVSTGPLPGATGFSQVIDSQFLAPDGTAISPPSSYDSQTVGADAAPSLLLGVTTITTWRLGATSRIFRSYTRITDVRPQLPVIQSQSRAVAVDITSTGADGATLELQGGVARLDGAQSSGSSVSGFVTGALATRTGQAKVTGDAVQFALPGQSAITSGSTSAQPGGGVCSWYAFGATGHTNVDGDVSAGLPNAPANVVASPPNVVTGAIQANGNGACGALSYDNRAGSGVPQTGPIGLEMGAAPYVKAPNVTGTPISATGYVTSNPLPTSPQQTKAGAGAAMASTVVLFPNSPEPSGGGLVTMQLTAASVDCVSGAGGVDGTVAGKYTLQLRWWGRVPPDTGRTWHTATWTYDSTQGTPLTRIGPSPDFMNTFLGNGVPLSDLVPSLTAPPAAVTTGATSGQRGFSAGIFSATTVSTLTNEPAVGASGIIVQLGQLTCVADDQR
jgi:prepilin-type N-terminal cleavage/methylation domain-containing protein